MKLPVCALALVSISWLGGCATSKNVTLAQMNAVAPIRTVATVKEEGNSSDMDTNLRHALMARHVTVSASLPTGTRTAPDVDAIVSYVDVWRWDIVMYLKSVSIGLFDAHTGNLLVTASWTNSAFHGYSDSQAVVQELVDDLFAKLQTATPAAAVAPVPVPVPADSH